MDAATARRPEDQPHIIGYGKPLLFSLIIEGKCNTAPQFAQLD
jgi:hypothetical protein